jgi:hypothetical protein
MKECPFATAESCCLCKRNYVDNNFVKIESSETELEPLEIPLATEEERADREKQRIALIVKRRAFKKRRLGQLPEKVKWKPDKISFGIAELGIAELPAVVKSIEPDVKIKRTLPVPSEFSEPTMIATPDVKIKWKPHKISFLH